MGKIIEIIVIITLAVIANIPDPLTDEQDWR